jgi:uncharacterized protein (DUF58 family)
MPLKEFKAKLIPEIKELNLFIQKNLLSSAMSGELVSSLKGQGIEFEDYRDYSVQDDAQRIDWRASKRAQRLLVREYRLDINFDVFLMIDVSESMLFASTQKLKCEYAAQVACSLFYGIIQTGNSVGFGLFNEGLQRINKPFLGKKQFYLFTREISNPKIYGGKKDMGKAMQQALTILDKRALIIIISDFITHDESWVQFFKILAERHEVIGIMVRDPRDIHLPKDAGQFVMEDPFSKDRIYVDTANYFEEYEQYNLKQLKLVQAVFEHNKSSLLELTTDVHYLNPMLQFLRKRGGRWR